MSTDVEKKETSASEDAEETCVIYEVNLEIQSDVGDAMTKWLEEKHLVEMLEFPGFMKAQLFTRDAADENSSAKGLLLTCQYTVNSRGDLENYFKTGAAKMRAEGLEKFPGKFTANRRILKLSKTFL